MVKKTIIALLILLAVPAPGLRAQEKKPAPPPGSAGESKGTGKIKKGTEKESKEKEGADTAAAGKTLDGVTFAADPGTLYVPLKELGEALDWPVSVDPKTGIASLNDKEIEKRDLRWLLNGTLLVALRHLEKRDVRIEWSEGKHLATIRRGERALQVREGAKRVVINRARQRLRAWQGDRIILRTRVSTGRKGHETPTGFFRAGPLKTRMLISRRYDDAKMPWSVQVRGNVLMHGFPSVPPRAASHGCIRIPLRHGNPAKWLYDWIDIGTPVTIADGWRLGRRKAAPARAGERARR
jgi:hypothetical protein